MSEREFQDRVTSDESHQRFVRRVIEGGQVWGLKRADGWAVCDSLEHEGTRVMPFWSDRAYAARGAREEWAAYAPTPISLATFLEVWLTGMQQEGVLVGPNWDASNCGVEREPGALADELKAGLLRP
jgi:hypothetical protein